MKQTYGALMFGFAVCGTLGCGDDSKASGGAGPGSSSQSSSSGVGGSASCRFPTFERASDWLRTTDEGQCDAASAAAFSGDCENFHWLGLLGDPWVLRQGNEYRMWYTGGFRLGPEEWRATITEATSDDGILWRDPKNLETDVVPVLQPGTAGIDEEGVETISVLQAADGEYRMYYAGARAVTPNVAYVIGLATSSDGKTWTKRPAPVLSPTLPWEAAFDAGGFEVGGVLEPSVSREGERWRMWYTAFGKEDDGPSYSRMGYAESSDGFVWEKNPEPIFRSSGQSFEALGVSHTHVIADPVEGYHLFYVGIAGDETLRMGHAWSADGLAWEPNPNNPILSGVPGEWDAGLVGGPSAVFVDGELRLYYMGTPKPDFSQPVRFAMTTGRCQ